MIDESKGKLITFRCSDDVAARLDRMSEKTDVPRSKLVANMVEGYLDFLEGTEKIGLFQVTILIEDAKKKLKEVAEEWKNKKVTNGKIKSGYVK